MRYDVFICLIMTSLIGGCKMPSVPSGGQAASEQATQASSAAVKQPAESAFSSQQGKERMDSPLAQLLRIFVSPQGSTWAAYDSATAVTWRDQAPAAVAGTSTLNASHRREGKLLLTGFPDAQLPNGEVGASAGSRSGNEGEAGVTLFGSADSVQSFAVMKFYPSDDYPQTLSKQFSGNVVIQLIADDCGDDAPDPEARHFFQLRLPSAGTAYVEAYVDAEGGKYNPGSTTFEFYRTAPVDRIQKFGCQNR